MQDQLSFQIIWDAQNQKWVNKDQDEDEKESFKPPPKITDLAAMQSAVPKPTPNIPIVESMQSYGAPPTPLLQESIAPSNNDPAAAAKVPNLQSNMFKMQRNKSKIIVTYAGMFASTNC